MTPGYVPSPTRRRLAAGLSAAALAAGTLAGLPGPAAATPATGQVTGPVRAAARAEVPCPKPDVKPPAGRPARPTPPGDDPVLRAVGGDDLATDGLVAPAGVKPPPALTATSWLVADLDTGEVLGGCGPHVYGTPASVQKLLLVATVMDKLDPKKTITITDDDLNIEPGSSAVGLLKGGRYTIATLWLGLLLQSGNEAANALARLGGGSGGVRATVAAMNAKAHQLGAYQTHAVTPSGLDGPGQFTSAYDLALIARDCFAKADFRTYALTKNTQIPAQKQLKKGGFQIQNENRLIFNYPGAMGGKTGFTKLARHSYVGAAQRNGRRLVATLLGAEASPLRGYEQGAALLDWGFSLPKDASVGKLVAPDGQDATGTAADEPAPARSAAPATKAAPAAARPAAGTGPGMPLVAAAAVAIVLAATPLLLLLTQRRRRVRRRPRRRPQAFY
ncbi:D-alanyl-D-alanine carboxypeptidase family protein [Actinoplanes sp. N902-109]|uniref:D-alanyl-D-alanine carboxypeptidase family protein n=1 Tax=Actinoplanes sp. (strain N902-109) TaxID=649831 RepID=UPI000329378A|nr:serine hydrolase [Actinoplanes sp. N902-109]AGL19724.1 peptidase s11 d-alanyl-d-alanine carboxypeptidase 1 [Actinoplanes sp. N902-109]